MPRRGDMRGDIMRGNMRGDHDGLRGLRYYYYARIHARRKAGDRKYNEKRGDFGRFRGKCARAATGSRSTRA
eukprot:1967154-Rhodomonas_salina.1